MTCGAQQEAVDTSRVALSAWEQKQTRPPVGDHRSFLSYRWAIRNLDSEHLIASWPGLFGSPRVGCRAERRLFTSADLIW